MNLAKKLHKLSVRAAFMDSFINDLFNIQYQQFKTWQPFNNQKCKRCPDLILCGGNYFCRQNQCDFERYNVELFIKKYIEYVLQGKEHMFVNM